VDLNLGRAGFVSGAPRGPLYSQGGVQENGDSAEEVSRDERGDPSG
jgi:hypothetical protein